MRAHPSGVISLTVCALSISPCLSSIQCKSSWTCHKMAPLRCWRRYCQRGLCKISREKLSDFKHSLIFAYSLTSTVTFEWKQCATNRNISVEPALHGYQRSVMRNDELRHAYPPSAERSAGTIGTDLSPNIWVPGTWFWTTGYPGDPCSRVIDW